MERLLWVSLLVSQLSLVAGDVYMHNPRGSNDRNCERNANRNNGNRLFNSQNNAAGGYACPRAVGDESMQNEAGDVYFSDVDATTGKSTSFKQNKRLYYYAGSVLPIEWTGQHGCGGNSKISCEIIIQYACEDTLDPRVDNFWPWVTDKAEATSKYYGQQHFRSGNNIAAPRDGVPISADDAATDTITDNVDAAIPNTATTRRFGMQESYDYYQVCQRTERNKGLYTADQLIQRNDRRGTRQNPNGNRNGFECPEERDYYPWWAPSPWIDIAVLTDSGGDDVCYKDSASCTKRCNYYMNNTMNWNTKGYCDVDHTSSTVSVKTSNTKWQTNQWYNNKDACTAAGFKWYAVSHKDNLSLSAKNNFVCAKTQFSRVNQLGNGRNDDIVSQSYTYNSSTGVAEAHVAQGVNANRFIWTIPDIPTVSSQFSSDPSKYFSPNITDAYKSCVLRIRYNISSADFQSWPTDATDAGTSNMVDSRNNSSPGSTSTKTPLHQDPYVYIGVGDLETQGDKFVSLAVNTNQYARTFQDRSYVFSIKPLPTSSASESTLQDTPRIDYTTMKSNIARGGKIYNVNVRGKRGNIVQVYPSVEYDFIPNALALNSYDMVHFQWTGSDYNPRRGCNDGEGGPPDANTFSTSGNADQNPRADRSNIILTAHMATNVPMDYGYDSTSSNYTYKFMKAKQTLLDNAPCYDSATDTAATGDACYATLMRLAYLNQQRDGGSLVLRAGKSCLTQTEIETLAKTNNNIAEYHPLNCAKMNAKPYPYFDGGILFTKKSGWFPFFSSRNNNFSNRQQIGILCVGSACKVDNSTGVLQDSNPATNGITIVKSEKSKLSQKTTTSTTSDSVISGETFSTSDADNDLKGDGNKYSCLYDSSSEVTAVEKQVGLAVGLLFVGLFVAWLSYYLYNRYQAMQDKGNAYRNDTSWMNKDSKELTASDARPSHFAHKNPGVNHGIAMSSTSPLH